jgi:hypothetical protein
MFDHISLNSPVKKCFGQTLQRKSQHAFCVQYFFFNLAVYEVMRYTVEREGHMTP